MPLGVVCTFQAMHSSLCYNLYIQVSKFVVYTGKPDGLVKNLGHSIVMKVCRDILNKGHKVCFDNCFSRVGFSKQTVNSAVTA